MQIRNREAENFVGNEHLCVDFPTEEELLAALDASLAASLQQAPRLPHPVLLAVDTATQNLHEQAQTAPAWSRAQEKAQSLREGPAADEKEIVMEPEFLADFIQFLTQRVTQRMKELHQAQQQLAREVARLRRKLIIAPPA